MVEIAVPEKLIAYHGRFRGEEGLAWIARLPRLAASYLRRWGLTPDGAPMHGMVALVLPVRRADGVPAALKLQPIDPEHLGEGVALRAWDGQGAVRLLAEDETADSSILLLERLRSDRMLRSLPDIDQAVGVLTGLLARLNAHRAPPEIRRLDDVVAEMIADAPMAVAAQSDPDEAKLLARWVAMVAELAGHAGDRLLHWDLHYYNVLAAEREPWLAIDPKPLAGHPGFELLPALDNRWTEAVGTGDAGRAIRRRFDQMIEALALDRAEAVAWIFARILQNEIWSAEDTEEGELWLDPKQIVIAEAIAGPAPSRTTSAAGR